MLANSYQPVVDELVTQLVEAYEDNDNDHDKVDKVIEKMGRVMRQWMHYFKEAYE